MKVRGIMTPTPAYCTRETNLGAAVETLWKRNCGILPVVDNPNDKKVVSVITDRDICIALGTRNVRAGEVAVGEVATHPPICCRPDEDIQSALAKMAQGGVRRLPVVNGQQQLEGILSMDDVVVEQAKAADGAKGYEHAQEEILDTLKSIFKAQVPRTSDISSSLVH